MGALRSHLVSSAVLSLKIQRARVIDKELA